MLAAAQRWNFDFSEYLQTEKLYSQLWQPASNHSMIAKRFLVQQTSLILILLSKCHQFPATNDNQPGNTHFTQATNGCITIIQYGG